MQGEMKFSIELELPETGTKMVTRFEDADVGRLLDAVAGYLTMLGIPIQGVEVQDVEQKSE